MKVLQKITIFTLLFLVAVTLAGLLLPRQYLVRREVTIQARPEVVFRMINRPNRWPEWTVWTTNLDPTLKHAYFGPVEGIGAGASWIGNKVGDGAMKLTASSPTNGIGYDISFHKGRFRSRGVIQFQPATNGILVVWTDEGDLGSNPVDRYYGLVIDRLIGPDLAAGLTMLKLRAENQ